MSNMRAEIILKLRERLSGPARKVRRQLKAIGGETRRMSRAMRAASVDTGHLAREQVHAARGSVGLINSFRSLKSRARQTGQQLNQTQHRLNELAGSGKKTSREFSTLRNRARQLKGTLRNQNVALEGMRRGLNKAGISTRKLISAERDLNQSIRRSTRAIREQERAFRRRDRAAHMMDRQRDRRNRLLGRSAAVGGAGLGARMAGQRILRGVAGTVGSYGNLEAQMDAVGARAGISQDSDQYRALFARARELGATTEFTSSEVGAGMEFQAMAGFSPEEILAAIAGTLDLAKASGTDLGVASDIGSNILSGFELPADQMQRVADVLVATTNRSNTDVSMLGDTMKYVAPIASRLGIELETAAAMAGALGDVGIQGSMAGTGLRAIFSRLSAPGKPGQEAFDTLGIETKDAAGNLRPILDLINEIGAKTAGMGSADQMEILKAIAGEEAASALAVLISDTGREKTRSLYETNRNAQGEAHQVAVSMAQNLPGDIKSARSAFSGLMETLGGSVNEEMRAFTQWVTKGIRATNEWFTEHPKFAKVLMLSVAALGAFLAVAGTLMIGLGALGATVAITRFGMAALGISSWAATGRLGLLGRAFRAIGKFRPLRWAALIPSKITPISIAITALRSMAVGLGALFAGISWPIWAVVAAVASLGAVIYKFWEPISNFAAGFASEISSELGAAMTSIKNFASDFMAASGAFVREAAIDVGAMLGIDRGKIERVLDGAISIVKSKLGTIVDFFKGFPAKIGNWFSDLFSIKDYSSAAEAEFRASGKNMARALIDGIKGIGNDLKSIFGAVDLTGEGARIVQSLWDGFTSIFDSLIAWVKTKIAELKALFSFKLPSLGGTSWHNAPVVAEDGFARGGTIGTDAPVMVGEEGPELMYRSRGAFVAHNSHLRRMAALARHAAASAAIATPLASGAAAAPPLLPQLAAAGVSASDGVATGSTPGAASAQGGGTTIEKMEINLELNVARAENPEELARQVAAVVSREIKKRLND